MWNLLGVSNILLWILMLIQLIFLYLLTKTFASYTKNFHKNGVAQIISIDDQLPIFKAKDQRGGVISSDKFLGNITKLIFLSDHCGSCFQVLDKLEEQTLINNYLVIKSDKSKDSSLDIDDRKYKFSIVRSTKIMNIFGIEKVPTLLSFNQKGTVEDITELKDLNNLVSMLES